MPPEQYGLNMASLFYSSECEIADALLYMKQHGENLQFLSGLVAKATFLLNVIEVTAVNGGTTLILPYTNVKITASIGAGINDTRNVLTTVDVIYDFEEILKRRAGSTTTGWCEGPLDQSDEDPDVKARIPQILRIQNAIGVGAWFKETYISMQALDMEPTNLAYNASFKLKADGNAGAKFDPAVDDFETVGGEFGLSGSREVEQKLSLVTAKAKDFQTAPRTPGSVSASLASELNQAQTNNILQQTQYAPRF
ncbi:hypothetical protein ATO13_20159 [Stappia sp. 22II-S9-Z10]|nr:hypothetical protein ATO13_20159 [Stappia sp. 22II-S9-Z10]